MSSYMAMELNFLTTMLWPCPLPLPCCSLCVIPCSLTDFSERSPSFSLPCMFSAHPVLPVREREMSLFFELLPFHYQLKCYTLTNANSPINILLHAWRHTSLSCLYRISSPLELYLGCLFLYTFHLY